MIPDPQEFELSRVLDALHRLEVLIHQQQQALMDRERTIEKLRELVQP